MSKTEMRKLILKEAIEQITTRFEYAEKKNRCINYFIENERWIISRHCFYNEPYFEDYHIQYMAGLGSKKIWTTFYINRNEEDGLLKLCEGYFPIRLTRVPP